MAIAESKVHQGTLDLQKSRDLEYILRTKNIRDRYMYAKALTALYEFETISTNPISTYHFTYVDNPLEYEYSNRDRRDLLSNEANLGEPGGASFNPFLTPQ